MAFKDLSPSDKLVACHTDFMKHKDFCILGGVTQIGKVEVLGDVATACTDGENVRYGEAFIKDMSRKQLRYLVGHENMHKAMHHCTAYTAAAQKYPDEFAMAIDYVVNWQLESMDTGADKFLERPTSIPPLVDAKYADMGVLEVMRDLLKNPPPQGGGGGGGKQPMDVHIIVEKTPENEDDLEDVKQKLEDAVRHGEIVQGQLRSASSGEPKALNGFRESRTDWRPALRRFFQEICEGDDQSRFCPPNKRMLPLGIILPSHFSEMTGTVIIAVDCSGSMGHIVGVVLGEVARIAQQTMPKEVMVLWWDTRVISAQTFQPKQYADIARLMKPVGGGGTTVSCVADYIADKKLKPRCTIYLTDAYIESSYRLPPGPCLWGVVDNPRWVPLKGKVLHVDSST